MASIRGSNDTDQSICSTESMYHDAGEVRCSFPVLLQAAKPEKDHTVSEGGIEIDGKAEDREAGQ